jgi:hypothetical protein
MNGQIANTNSYPTSHPQIGREAIVCGLWLRVAFIGASAIAVGVMQLFGGEIKLVPALALAVAGGLLTAFSMRRARGALDAADDAASMPVVGAGSPARSLAI